MTNAGINIPGTHSISVKLGWGGGVGRGWNGVNVRKCYRRAFMKGFWRGWVGVTVGRYNSFDVMHRLDRGNERGRVLSLPCAIRSEG